MDAASVPFDEKAINAYMGKAEGPEKPETKNSPNRDYARRYENP